MQHGCTGVRDTLEVVGLTAKPFDMLVDPAREPKTPDIGKRVVLSEDLGATWFALLLGFACVLGNVEACFVCEIVIGLRRLG